MATLKEVKVLFNYLLTIKTKLKTIFDKSFSFYYIAVLAQYGSELCYFYKGDLEPYWQAIL